MATLRSVGRRYLIKRLLEILCLSKSLHLVVMEELYRSVKIPMSGKRGMEVQNLQVVQGAVRMARIVKHLDYLPLALERNSLTPGFLEWKPTVDASLDALFSQCKFRSLKIRGSCPLFLSTPAQAPCRRTSLRSSRNVYLPTNPSRCLPWL